MMFPEIESQLMGGKPLMRLERNHTDPPKKDDDDFGKTMDKEVTRTDPQPTPAPQPAPAAPAPVGSVPAPPLGPSSPPVYTVPQAGAPAPVPAAGTPYTPTPVPQYNPQPQPAIMQPAPSSMYMQPPPGSTYVPPPPPGGTMPSPTSGMPTPYAFMLGMMPPGPSVLPQPPLAANLTFQQAVQQRMLQQQAMIPFFGGQMPGLGAASLFEDSEET